MLHAGVGRRCASQALGRCLSGSADRRGRGETECPSSGLQHRCQHPRASLEATHVARSARAGKTCGGIAHSADSARDGEGPGVSSDAREPASTRTETADARREEETTARFGSPQRSIVRDVGIGCLVCPAHFAVVGSLRGATPCVSLPNLVPSQCTGITLSGCYQEYCKSRIFRMHVIFVYFVRGGFRT